MAGNEMYARHGFARWLAIIATAAVFTLSLWLYGVPLSVFLALLSTSAYCAVAYASFTLEGHHGRSALERGYNQLFTAIYGSGAGTPNLDKAVNKQRDRRRRDQASLQCHKEAQKMIQLIMRDFVCEWYKNITTEVEFPDDCQKILEHVALEINMRMQHIDLDEVVHEVLAALLPCLEVVNQAGKLEYNGVEIFDATHEKCLHTFEENHTVAHRALRSPDTETRYYRQLLDAVIQCALPEEYRTCDLACMFLREILLSNLLEPLIILICDPDFLNKAIPKILKKADPVEVQIVLEHIQEENKELECTIMNRRLVHAHKRSTRRFHSMSEHYPISTKPIPVPLSRVVCPHSNSYVTQCEGEMEEGIEEVDLGEEPEEEEEEEEDEVIGGEGASGSDHSIGVVHSSEIEAEDCIDGGHTQSPSSSLGSSSSSIAHDDTPTLIRKGSLLNLTFLARKSSSRRQTNTSRQQRPQNPPTLDATASNPVLIIARHVAVVASSSSLDCDSDCVYVDLPPIFATRYLHIHQNNNTYIGYVFKFPKSMLSSKDQMELGLPSNETHLESVKRYSDFTRLHQQLQKTPDLYRHAQGSHGLDLPERHGFANVVSKLPFASRDLDPTSLLERKQGLEKYIQLVSSKQEILESRLFQEFLTSGVVNLREINTLHPQRSRHRRTLLGLMKGHSDEPSGAEAQPLPKRPMESVLSSYLNTTLPLPCRNLNTPTSQSNRTVTGKTGLPEDGGCRRKPVLTKAATIEENSSNELYLAVDAGRRRTVSLNDNDRELMRGADENLPIESETELDRRKMTDDSSDCHGNGINFDAMETVTMATSQPQPQIDQPTTFTRIKNHIFIIFSSLWYYIITAVAIVRQCSIPLTHNTLNTMIHTQQSRNPLSDVLLALATEASKRHCHELWVTDKSTQTAVLTLVGGGIDRYLSQELHVVMTKEDNWTRMLYNLRHTLWVDGSKELDRSPRETLTEEKREERKKMAAKSFKKFLPNFLPYLVGGEVYSHAITHCIDCLQNPQINRHFILRVVDIILPKLVPELHSDEFQKQLARLRTLTSTHAHKVPHSRPLSTYSKKV